MTEKEFWGFLEQRGKMDMISGSIVTGDIAVDSVGEFMAAHALLPKDYDNLTEENIQDIGGILFQENIQKRTKEAVLILLAHQVSELALAILTRYNLRPDKEIFSFAKLALDESLIWNE